MKYFAFALLIFSSSVFALPECLYQESGLPAMLYVRVRDGASGTPYHDTAVVLSPRMFLTTGHLLHEHKARGDVVHGGVTYFFTAYRNPQYVNTSAISSAYDLTVGVLDSPLSNVKTWKVGMAPSMENAPVSVAGCLNGNLRENTGTATSFNGDKEMIFTPEHTPVMTFGDGGGPLWIWDAHRERRLLGILTTLRGGNQRGYTGMNPANIRFIRRIAEMHGLAKIGGSTNPRWRDLAPSGILSANSGRDSR